MQNTKLPDFYSNLIPNFQSCVRKSFLGMFKKDALHVKVE